MVILGTTKAEEEALHAASREQLESRLLYVSTDPSALSAYETASEFGDDPYFNNGADETHIGDDLYTDDADNDTIELAHEDAGAASQKSILQNRGSGVPSSTLPEPLLISADAVGAPRSSEALKNVELPSLEVNVGGQPLSGEAYIAPPQASVGGTQTPAEMNDEDLILPVQNHIPFDPTGMTEDELNRVVTQHSERGESLILEKTLTTASHIDVRDLAYDDETDRANPFNWPSWKKWFVTFTIANSCLCISLGSSLYIAAVPELMQVHHSSETLTISGLTFYLLGLALGPAIAAPLSELIGRRYIYLFSFPSSMLFAMGVGLGKNMRTILILRFFCGLVGSPPMALAGGSISDVWSNCPKSMSLAMSLFCLCPFLGPIIGPIVGGFAAEHKNWQWTMWVYLMFSGAVLPFLLACPETFKAAILEKRYKKRGISVIKPKFDFKKTVISSLGRPLEMLVVEPIVCFTSIYIAFIFAVLFGFFEAYPIIFRGIYRMDMGVSGLPFIGVGVGLLLGVVGNIILSTHKANKKKKLALETGTAPAWDAPETHLQIVEIGACFLPVALFWLAWTSRRSIHWISPTLAGVPFGFGLMWVFLGIMSYYAYSFPPAYVASAISANNLLRYLLAAVFPLFVVQMYRKLHVDWATSLFAFISLAMVPIPFIFRRYGERIRLRSKYGYVAYFKALAEEEKKNQEAQEAAGTSAENKSMTLSSSPVPNRV